MSRQQHYGVVCLWVLVMIGWVPRTASAQWTVVNLHPPGAVESRCFGLQGMQQVGQADFGGSRSILWTGAVDTWKDLHPPAGTFSDLLDAFDGQQVGAVQMGGAGHASLWTGSSGSWVDLHPLGATFSSAEGIGGHSAFPGLIHQVGGAFESGVHQASLWSGSAASWTSLHPPPASFSIAYDVDDGQQVGMAVIGGTTTASLWTGTSASWVSLHPVGAVTSSATAVHGGEQVGFIGVGGLNHAGKWSGTAASWVDLNPAGLDSEAHAVYAGRQAGEVRVSGIARASVWSGTAASWEDLHPYLGPSYVGGASSARGIWSDGATTHVAGYAFNTAVSRYEAILWVETATAPSHDDCSAAQALGDGATVFHNVGATTDGPAESCLPVGFNGMDDSDVWYEYIANCEGVVSLEVHGGNFDVLAGVYSGTCGGALLGCGLAPVGGHAFGMSVPAIPGETFLIRLGGQPGDQGVGSLNIQCIPSIGACCDTNSVCGEVSPSSCSSIGGTYHGDGSMCITTPCPAPAPQINFAAASTLPTGVLPVAVVPGDFDLDGDNDLVVLNRGDQTFSVLNNDGSGNFQFAYGSFLGNPQQEDAVAADLDADGALDLAIAVGGVRLYRNNGGLGFWMSLNVGTTDVRAIIAEDFDGDCSIDLATANTNPPGNDVTVLLNVNGDFTQPTLTHYSAGTNPIDLAAADMDQDGFPDIVVANAGSGDVTILYNNGAGVFSTSTSYHAGLGCCTTALAVGDLDGDLFPDVVITHSANTQISVMMNDGVGGLASPTVLSAGNSAWDVALADLDGDDDLDVLLVITNFPYQIVVLTNDGSGAFYAPLTFNTGTGPRKLAVAHFDSAQDGDLDVAVPLATDELAVLLNIGEQDCNANSVPDDIEAIASLNFTITGASNATPCSFRVFGSGFDVQGEFCVTTAAGPAAFVNEVIDRINEGGCPGIRAERIFGLTDGFTVSAPGNSLDFCIGNAPGPATCCFSSNPVCSCNPDIEEFFFSGEDCNANGMDDAIDIYSATSADRNGDGIPDECAPLCTADLNNNGAVNAADLALLLGSWGPCPGCVADINGNDVVNAADLALLLGNWGPCGQ